MTWRRRYRPASFRGVPFFVEAHETQGSRRVVTHEFVGRDTPLVQDRGRGIASTALEAYVLGDDYDIARDRLLAALEQEGPGELVHPYLGTMRVQVLAHGVRETAQDGGTAKFAISFIESGELATGLRDSRAEAEARAINAADATLDAAEAGYNPNTFGQPDSVLEGIVDSVEAFSAKLESFSISGPLETVAKYQRLAERLADAMLAVISFPARQAVLLRDAITALDAAVDSRQVLLELHLDALSQTPNLRGGTSAFASLRNENAQAAADLFLTMHAAEAVRAAVATRWASRQDAERARASILLRIDTLQLTVGDMAYRALGELAAALVAALPGPDSDLPELVDLELAAPVPAVVLAYRLYDDHAREADLVARNRSRIAHPGRIATGTRLEVLSA
jgi:prophage DNA circulation protein